MYTHQILWPHDLPKVLGHIFQTHFLSTQIDPFGPNWPHLIPPPKPHFLLTNKNFYNFWLICLYLPMRNLKRWKRVLFTKEIMSTYPCFVRENCIFQIGHFGTQNLTSSFGSTLSNSILYPNLRKSSRGDRSFYSILTSLFTKELCQKPTFKEQNWPQLDLAEGYKTYKLLKKTAYFDTLDPQLDLVLGYQTCHLTSRTLSPHKKAVWSIFLQLLLSNRPCYPVYPLWTSSLLA